MAADPTTSESTGCPLAVIIADLCLKLGIFVSGTNHRAERPSFRPERGLGMVRISEARGPAARPWHFGISRPRPALLWSDRLRIGLSSRVCLMINIEQSLLRDVGVNLGCRQISVAEQFLNATEVCSAIK